MDTKGIIRDANGAGNGPAGITRREALAALGGVFAVSALPAFGDDDPSQFPLRSNCSRLSLAYQHVKIGLPQPFSVLHLSDTHLTAAYPDEPEDKQKLRVRRTRGFGGRQEEALRDSLAWAKRNVDCVIHTGDLIDWQSRANLDLAKRYFGEGMTGCLGNHEFSPSMWLSVPKEEMTEGHKDRSRALLAAAYPFDIELQSTVVGGVNFVTMDDAFGTFTERQVARFAAEVAKGLPIVLCLHVPLYTPHIWRTSRKFWNEGRKFRDAAEPPPLSAYRRQLEDATTCAFIGTLRREPLLKAVLVGHSHITVQDRFSPTAMEFGVGANFMFHAEEILFS